MTRHIIVQRRSPTARFLDVQAMPDGTILTFDDDSNSPASVVTDEPELVAIINGSDTDPHAVEVNLARRVLGWSIP